MRILALALALAAAAIPLASAQSPTVTATPSPSPSPATGDHEHHGHHGHATPAPTPQAAPTLQPPATPRATPRPTATASPGATPSGVDPHAHFGEFEEAPPAPHAEVFAGTNEGVLGIPLTREASGTAWQPDGAPMYGFHRSFGPWTLMLHGNVYAGWLRQGDPDRENERGGEGFAGLNHVMAMARREIGGGDVGLRFMFSAEPWTVEDRGYPLLLQTGETFEDEPLHDRQHPHDLFMELAAMFNVPLGENVGLQLYAAPAGEPALGPVAFPHRVSAQANPLSPLSHHWQDSTHVAFGVATIGLFTRHVKLEGSAFNGREPDEDRLDLEYPGIDSWSARVSVMPRPELVMQASYAFLRSPHPHDPEVELRRATASALWSRPLGARGNAAAAVVWGRNMESGHEGAETDSFLVEGEITGDGRNTFFARGESVRKPGHDLALPHPASHELFDVSQFTLGYLLELGPWLGVRPAIGALANQSFMDAELGRLYGDAGPRGFMVFLRLRPGSSGHGAHHAPHH